jgi:PAS domain S-box-containing protein
MIALPGVTIQSQIYESSASLVYRGVREQDDRAIVIKLLKQDYPSVQELTRYRQEYEITRTLNLEGVVKAYCQQDYQRTIAILLEDFGGESINIWMQQRPEAFRPMPLSNFFQLAIKITDTLGKIHAANIIHRDINPSNIVLNLETGIVKIIDFGIATRFNRTNLVFRSPHQLEGTLAYLSPEQTGRMNRWVDYRTDFYSLGVTFYELLTGQLPFPTTNVLELVHCHIAKQPVPPHELNPAIPKPVSDLILKLMAKNAEDRYQSAWGIKADLELCAQRFAQSGEIANIQLGLQDVSEQFQIPQKLYGRDAEIRTLLAAFDRVSNQQEDASHSVELMLVSGCAGIGKSALVQELYQPITEKRGYFIWGKFDQFQRNIPYSAIVDALRKLVHQLLGEPDDRVQQWRSRVLTALGSNGQLIIDTIPEVELIIGKQPAVPEVGATEAQNRFNRVFGRFIRVFCSKEHPLVLFLDDLQWIDSATLKLIELMLLDEQTHSLFLIGAYRENELSSTHPLTLTLESLRKQGAVIQDIVLTSLTLEPLSQLIAETLHHNVGTVRVLAELILCKTEGNPFFVNEFLKTLYAENCLMFDVDRRNWQWNIEQIQAMDITDNVVVLMTYKLSKLSESVQELLQLAACVGNEFDLNTLSMICEIPVRQLFSNLAIAVRVGLILPTSELDENLIVQHYRFLHDRIQQSAYALIDESQKQVVRLQIGRNLLEKTSSEQLSARLFEIVDHLNRGIELVTDESERTELARLNLMAGQKAKAAMAYEAALQYFKTGLEFLDSERWQSEYDLTLALYSEAAEAAYLQGRFDEMEQFVEVVLSHAKTAIDKVQVYNSRIQRYLSQGNLKSALKMGLEVLNLLEVTLIETPSQLDIQSGLESTAALSAGREIEDLINLPKMTAPEPLAAIDILANIAGTACMVSPALMILIVCKMADLSINYGNAARSPHSYAAYGFVLCGAVQDIELGYKFGKLALSLAERLNSKKGNAEALTVFSGMIMPWKVHCRKTIPILVDAYQNGMETGDFEFAGYAAYVACYHSFFIGESLSQLEQKTATYSKAIRQIRRENYSNWAAILWQTILNLLGRSENPSRLIGSVYNEEQALSHAIAVKDGTGIHYFYVSKLILCYLFGEYHQAAQTAVLAREYLEKETATIAVPLFHFYHSLVLLSLLIEASSSEKAAWLSCVNTNQEKMQKWAAHAPMNYLHKFHLVEAEKARVLGQFFEAEEFYEQAIAGAAEHEFIQEEALAYELAAKHYLARGRVKIAQTYMKEAHYCYDRWGATAKVKDLENRYPQLLNSNLVRQSNPIVTDETIRRPTEAIDLAAVMKAAQALSEIIHLDQLIATLMQVVIENAGAETGALILLENDRLTVMAQCGESRQCDLKKTSVNDCATIPISVIHLVERTQETLVFDDAVSEPSYLTDPYIQNQQTRSLLCMPILKQSQLIGILYLENNLSTGVFNSDRLRVLKLLIAQAAISLENARLYQQLENYADTLERRVEERTQALQQEISDRQRTEEALLESEQLLNLFFSQSLDGFFIMMLERPVQWDNSVDKGRVLDYIFEHQRVTKVNDAMLAQYRASREQFIGITPNDAFAHDLAYGKEVWRRLFDAGKLHIETDERRLDGTAMWVEGYYICLYDSQGRLIGQFGVQRDISDRKQAEEALQRSETKFRNIFENSQVGIFRARLSDGLILDANQRFANLFGFDSPDEVIRLLHSVDCYVNPSDRQQAIELLTRDGKLQNFEVQMQKRDGTPFWALYSVRLNIVDECVEGVVADISDRKRAEEALRESEQLLNVSFSQSLDGFFIMMLDQPVQWDDSVDKDRVLDYVFAHQKVTKANDAILAQYGMSQEQFIGFTPNDLYAHDLAYGKRVWRDFFDAGKLYIETDERRLDGTSIWIEGNYICLYDSQGRIIGHFGVQRDISDRKRIENERKQAEIALQASEAELQALVSAIPDPMCIINVEGRVIETVEGNPSYRELHSHVGKTLAQLFAKEQADEFLNYIQQVLKTQQVLTVEYSQWMAGQETWFSARIAPIRHEQIVWLARDITALKQAEAASILEERNRMAREIHDTLAQAFTGILIQVGAATQVLEDEPEATQVHLDTIEDLARLGLTEARRSVTALRPQLLEEGNLSTALDRLVTQMRAATDTTLIYKIQGVAYSLPTEVDNNLLRIGQEALTNAIKYARASEIQIKLTYDDAQCCLRVKDDGQGFAVVTAPPVGGFGLLGMSERAERIGAQLRIESQPGQGTEIVVIVNH